MIGLCALEVTQECELYPCVGCDVIQRFGEAMPNLFEDVINSMKPGIVCPECGEQCQRVEMEPGRYYDQCKCGMVYGQDRIEEMQFEGQKVIEETVEPDADLYSYLI